MIRPTALDLATIGFVDPVVAVKIVGLDSLGGSPGFDVVNIQVIAWECWSTTFKWCSRAPNQYDGRVRDILRSVVFAT